MIFDVSPKQRTVDSVSDNSDQEISNNNKQGINYRKKPAPKPPTIASNENSPNILDSISSSFDSTTSKIKSKFGSLRQKDRQSNNNNIEHIKNHFEQQPPRVESPPVSGNIATVRRNHLSPRVDNARSRRPISICERPAVPPPSVPPRPSVTKPGSNEQASDSTNQRHSMFDLNQIDSKSIDEIEESDSPTHSRENLADSNQDSNNKSVGSLYPRLSPNMDSSDSPFTYPCSEFIDENQAFMYASDDSIDKALDYDKSGLNTLAPQKPPRTTLATHSSQNIPDSNAEQSALVAANIKLIDRSPPPLPLRPSKSPSPIPSAIPMHPVATHSSANSNLIPNERTYL